VNPSVCTKFYNGRVGRPAFSCMTPNPRCYALRYVSGACRRFPWLRM